MLKHQRNMKKIKKECFKNMVAGPGLLEMQGIKGHKLANKDSILSGPPKAAHKNSWVGPTYNSDTEDNKQTECHVKEEVNREAKHW